MLSLDCVVIDCYDAQNLAEFWGAVLDAPIKIDVEEYVVVDSTPRMSFQCVPDPTPGKNRVHVDLNTEDLDGELRRLLELGATLVEQVSMRGGSWFVLADPEGNQFCLTGPFDLDRP